MFIFQAISVKEFQTPVNENNVENSSKAFRAIGNSKTLPLETRNVIANASNEVEEKIKRGDKQGAADLINQIISKYQLQDLFFREMRKIELETKVLTDKKLPKKVPDATRRANEKKTKENVDEALKEGEREKAKHPPKIPAPSEKKDTIVVTDEGIKKKLD